MTITTSFYANDNEFDPFYICEMEQIPRINEFVYLCRVDDKELYGVVADVRWQLDFSENEKHLPIRAVHPIEVIIIIKENLNV